MTDAPQDPLAPKITRETFLRLKGAVDAKKAKQVNGKPRGKIIGKEPNHYCRICTKVWYGPIVTANQDVNKMQPTICESCDVNLKAGMIAVIVPQTPMHCFVKSPSVVEAMKGKEPILEVSAEIFAQLHAEASKKNVEKN